MYDHNINNKCINSKKRSLCLEHYMYYNFSFTL